MPLDPLRDQVKELVLLEVLDVLDHEFGDLQDFAQLSQQIDVIGNYILQVWVLSAEHFDRDVVTPSDVLGQHDGRKVIAMHFENWLYRVLPVLA